MSTKDYKVKVEAVSTERKAEKGIREGMSEEDEEGEMLWPCCFIYSPWGGAVATGKI